MLILGVDTETTGLDPEKDRVIELGWCLWDTDTKKPLMIQNDLIDHEDIDIAPEITAINGIDSYMMTSYGQLAGAVFGAFIACIERYKPSALVAHNAPFDKAMISAELNRLCGAYMWDTPWIDTSTDVPYPKSIQTRKLTHLAAEHGFINPWPHRAITDVLTMLQVTSGYDWNEIMEVNKSPLIVAEARCQKPWEDRKPEGKKDTDIAKSLGFRFNPKTKQWIKNLRACHIDTFLEQVKPTGLNFEFVASSVDFLTIRGPHEAKEL